MNNNTIYNRAKPIAYDIPLSALFYIIWAGIPVEEYISNKAKPIYNKGPNGEDLIDDMEYIASLYEDEDDGL